MEIDLPDVMREVREAFERYERALVSNDVATLDEVFHNDPRTIRYGAAENREEEQRQRRSRPSKTGEKRGASRIIVGRRSIDLCR